MSENLDEMIQRYMDEMKRYTPARTAESPHSSAEDAPLLPTDPPAPMENQQKQAEEALAEEGKEKSEEITPSAQEEASYLLETETDRTEKKQEEWETSFATIIVQVFSAREALPLPGALVTITRLVDGYNVLVASLETDESGKTKEIQLPAPPAEWSEEPGHEHPFGSYNVRTDKTGYYSVGNMNLPVFGGITSIQPVEMIPVPEKENDLREILIYESQNPDL